MDYANQIQELIERSVSDCTSGCTPCFCSRKLSTAKILRNKKMYICNYISDTSGFFERNATR